MQSQPKLTISGYRGIWGESLNSEIVQNYTHAFTKFLRENINQNPTILIGRDGRESGLEIKKIIIKELKNLNINFIDGDILPTPTVLFAVSKYKYDGAIVITASHNPIEYNGLKFVTKKALFANEMEVEKIKENYEEIEKNEKQQQNITHDTVDDFLINIFTSSLNTIDKTFREKILPKLSKKGATSQISTLPIEHVEQIVKRIPTEKIRSRKFKVVVDMINASACVLDPYLFDKLEVQFIAINNIPNGLFAHKPEPLKENLGDIANLVKSSGADIGFAHDPDADRLVVIDEKGVVLSEEYTIALGTEAVLSKNHKNKVVINMSTSQMNKDIAEKYEGTCIRTKVGEANVVKGIIDNDAIIGGEGGGGVIYPLINMARDSFVSIALILELLAERNQTISQCIESLPKYEIRKDKMPIEGDLNEMYKKMKEHFKDATVNELDGLRLDFSDSAWIHLRPSNTEPIIRMIGEAKTKERIDGLFEETKKVIK